MRRDSTDNVTVIFIAFKNFENKMKDPSFVYKGNVKCKEIKKDQYDFSLIDIKKQKYLTRLNNDFNNISYILKNNKLNILI